MFRIRRVFDDLAPFDARALEQVRGILRAQFPLVRPEDADGLAEKLRNPFKRGLKTRLYVADDETGTVRGFAMLSHEPSLRFAFLDYIAAGRQLTGRGVGGALYEQVRDECRRLGALGLFLECLPDDRAECESDEQWRANVQRLKFYERFGARPLVDTGYETPLKPGERGMPHLVYDPLDGAGPLDRATARKVIRTILERNYAHLCPPSYVAQVVASVRDDPVRVREPRYVRAAAAAARAARRPAAPIPLVVNDQHDIHHVRERGYVEAPVRISAILRAIEPSGLFRQCAVEAFPDTHLRAVHEPAFVDYLKRVCANLPPEKSVYPYVFPIRNATRAPSDLAIRAGYYCIDTFTPLNANAFLAARRAVDCTLTAAQCLLRGDRVSYALVRPPGHHAERRAFGGFCYFNNAAVAAHYLSRQGRVAILDVDYHHGNGQEVIFYDRADVLTVSIHGHPRFAYPYFTGFADETGTGAGLGCNLNLPMPESVDGARYREALRRALGRVREFAPRFLVVALGLDTARGDPTGSWTLTPADLAANGRMIGDLRLPTLVVQEGGYRTRTLGENALRFFEGLAETALG